MFAERYELITFRLQRKKLCRLSISASSKFMLCIGDGVKTFRNVIRNKLNFTVITEYTLPVNALILFICFSFNLLKPTGHVMHQDFNIQQQYSLPTYCIYVFCIYLRTNSNLCHLQHKLIGFYNRDEKCLLRGTYWVFK